MSVTYELSARAIVDGVHSGEFSVREVASAFLERIDRYDDAIQAFVTVEPATVLAEADWLDSRRASGARLPLHGIPVGVKDIIDVAGLPTIAGFAPFASNIAHADADIVASLRSLGAFVIGKTHTTQFAVGDPAPTANPWNLEKSPAGSSAGSGAAVAAGMAPVSLGTQTAGSMLRPAAFNGVAGFKPTHGWWSMDGVLPLCWSLDHLGIYSSDISGLTLIYDALTGRARTSASQIDGRYRVAVLSEFRDMSSPEVAQHIDEVAASLEDVGASVEETALPFSFDYLFAVHQIIFAAEMAAVHGEHLDRNREHYGPRIAVAVDAGRLVPATQLLQAMRHRRILEHQITGFMNRWDVLLLPTVSTDACDRSETGDRRFQVPATLLGLPAISLPTGLSNQGLPLAAQLIGKRGSEQHVLSAASRLEAKVPPIGRPDLEWTTAPNDANG